MAEEVLQETVEDVYGLYRRNGSHGGAALSLEEFRVLWSGIGADDRRYWLRQFHGGQARLTAAVVRELAAAFDDLKSGISTSPIDPELLAAIRSRVDEKSLR